MFNYLIKFLLLLPQVSAHELEGADQSAWGDIFGPILFVVVIVIAVAIRKIIVNMRAKKIINK